ncbi:predicted protein [Histoplasma capsulatum H143]|uniref:Uncharacterized protein n=1 Tax=Ajellomyces capsulatus (strain H143) TaxID=544712 RepID=C6HE71_AJECH|nr:predicted protein [Histoplasma capsulatum H143]
MIDVLVVNALGSRKIILLGVIRRMVEVCAFPLESGYSKLHSARAAGTGESEGGFDKVDAALACKLIPDDNNNEELSDWSPRPRLLWLGSSKSSQGDVGAIVAAVAFGA